MRRHPALRALPALLGLLAALSAACDRPKNKAETVPESRGATTIIRLPAGKAALAAMGADRFVITAHEDYADMYAMAASVDCDFGK